jgi:hypothetical protein
MRIRGTFSPVDPQEKPWTLKNAFPFYLPEGWKLFSLAYRLPAYRCSRSLDRSGKIPDTGFWIPVKGNQPRVTTPFVDCPSYTASRV